MFCRVILFLSIALIINSQSFTRVEVGAPVEDGGDSRAVNWVDYDNDGDLDLFITNGPSRGQNNFFYINNGDGTFTKVTDIAIVNDNSPSDGSTWGDINNDGFFDLYVVNWYGVANRFYINNGDRTFDEVTGKAINASNSYSETASWGDFDNDGLLDLYVANSGGNRRNMLFQNDDDIQFTRITTGSHVTDGNYTRDVDWIDINGDGLLDIYVVNESSQNNALYLNKGDGTFEKVTDMNIVQDGKTSWSSNWIDFNNDGYFDLFLTNRDGSSNSLYKNNGDGTFTQITEGEIVTEGGYSSGSDWGDVNNDGFIDLYVGNAFANGQEIDNYFYLNNGDGSFTKITSNVTEVGGWTYGVSFGDFNRDGYLDLALAKCFGANENNALFLNDGGNNNWVIINLEGVKSNRSGIGSVIRVKANINGNDFWQARRVEGQNGYCGQNLEAHFGLGDAASIDSVIVEWSGGEVQILTDVEINSVTLIKEEVTTSVGQSENLEQAFELYQNYPNPFNPSTNIKFTISNVGNDRFSSLRLVVYDVLGREIETLVNGTKMPGTYEITFDASRVASGIYYYQLTTDNFVQTKKMMVVK